MKTLTTVSWVTEADARCPLPSFPLLWIQKRYQCAACGHTWKLNQI